MKVQVKHSSETWVDAYPTTRRHTPEFSDVSRKISSTKNRPWLLSLSNILNCNSVQGEIYCSVGGELRAH
jgi:hypothetical protein